MYLRNVLIRALKIKNGFFLVIGAFLFFTGIANMISLYASYPGDWDTIMHAKSTPEATTGIIIGIVLLFLRWLSVRLIKSAAFYSSYFECDLDGYISIKEIADVSGKSQNRVLWELFFLRLIYMKKFEFKYEDNTQFIELYSKKVLCCCTSCGAAIDKRIYFTGICPYCRTSDLNATVLTDNRVYNITNESKKTRSTPEFYMCRAYTARLVSALIALGISLFLLLILLMVILDSISNYNDPEYLKDVLLSGKSYSSYELIKWSIMDGIIWDTFFALIILPIAVIMIIKLIQLSAAKNYSGVFAKSDTPFIPIGKLVVDGSDSKKVISRLRMTISSGYLRNCSFDKRGNDLQLTLARKIVKDRCPHCGASITGAVSENYVCEYCKNNIMNVIRKK